MASAMGFCIMVLLAAGIIIVNLLLHNSNHQFHYSVTFFLYIGQERNTSFCCAKNNI